MLIIFSWKWNNYIGRFLIIMFNELKVSYFCRKLGLLVYVYIRNNIK